MKTASLALRSWLILAMALVGFTVSGQSRDREDLEVDVGAAVLHATAWGKGDSVVLIAGAGGSSGDYESIGPAIASKGFHVLAVNARGVRGSTGSLENLTLHDYARDVARLLEKIGAGRAH